VIRARKSPLDGLPADAVDLIYNEQPLHRAVPAEDPLVILNVLDNTDKHEELNPAFVYTGVARGVDLIEVINPCKLEFRHNLWTAGMELGHDTPLARYFIEGDPRSVLRA